MKASVSLGGAHGATEVQIPDDGDDDCDGDFPQRAQSTLSAPGVSLWSPPQGLSYPAVRDAILEWRSEPTLTYDASALIAEAGLAHERADIASTIIQEMVENGNYPNSNTRAAAFDFKHDHSSRAPADVAIREVLFHLRDFRLLDVQLDEDQHVGAWAITAYGLPFIRSSRKLTLVAPFLHAPPDVPAKSLSRLQLIDRAWLFGFTLSVLPHGARRTSAPNYVKDGARVIFVRESNRSVSREYLLTLVLSDEFFARGLDAIQHFQTSAYYNFVITHKRQPSRGDLQPIKDRRRRVARKGQDALMDLDGLDDRDRSPAHKRPRKTTTRARRRAAAAAVADAETDTDGADTAKSDANIDTDHSGSGTELPGDRWSRSPSGGGGDGGETPRAGPAPGQRESPPHTPRSNLGLANALFNCFFIYIYI